MVKLCLQHDSVAQVYQRQLTLVYWELRQTHSPSETYHITSATCIQQAIFHSILHLNFVMPCRSGLKLAVHLLHYWLTITLVPVAMAVHNVHHYLSFVSFRRLLRAKLEDSEHNTLDVYVHREVKKEPIFFCVHLFFSTWQKLVNYFIWCTLGLKKVDL